MGHGLAHSCDARALPGGLALDSGGIEEVFQQGDSDQDVLTKYRIPLSQWRQFRDRLSLMNINAYTLFGNEEGLMETLAYKAIFAKSI